MEAKPPLLGIKVVEVTWAIVGPTTTRFFSDFGATVVRVESHTRPDIVRFGSPFKDGMPGIDRSAYGAEFNSSKYGISLDITKPKGREIALRLMKWADIVVQGMTPGTMAKLGLGYEDARKVRPDIIYLSTSIQGQTGPYALLQGYGWQAGALAGASHVTGWPDRAPSQPWGAVTDYFSPRLGAAAILAALEYRRRTGKGQHIDQSQTEAGIQLIAPAILDCMVNNRVANRNGNRSPRGSPHGVYRCQGEDRWCAIAVFNDGEWQAFCEAIGHPAWTTEAKFATFLGRKAHEDELDTLVEEWTIQFTAEEVMTRMQAAGVAAGVAQSVKDLFGDPQLKHRGHFRWLKHAVIGPHAYHSPSFRFSETPDCQSAGPALGQHNEYVYKELLGMSDDEIADLLVEGVITTEAHLPKFKTA